MSKTYRPWNPNQQWLLPPSVHDWLPEDDLVYFLLDTVNELDISAITAKYEHEERGYPPYNPHMMVALLFYAYCRGIFSSRKIMQALRHAVEKGRPVKNGLRSGLLSVMIYRTGGL